LFGDWGVHILGPANWALQLSPASLISVETVKREGISPFTYPVTNAVKYEFGPRGNLPPVTVYWNDCVQGDAYLPPGMTAEEARQISGKGPQIGPSRGQGGFFPGAGAQQPPARGEGGGVPGGPGRGAQGPGQQAARGDAAARPVSSGYNCIFVGTKGFLGTSGRGEGVGLLPGSRWAEYQLPNAYLPRSPGASTGSNAGAHARDWVRACKGGAPACSNFSIAGPYTEWLVLGAVAVHYEGKILWDNARGEVTNNKDANRWVRPAFRKGWEIRL